MTNEELNLALKNGATIDVRVYKREDMIAKATCSQRKDAKGFITAMRNTNPFYDIKCECAYSQVDLDVVFAE